AAVGDLGRAGVGPGARARGRSAGGRETRDAPFSAQPRGYMLEDFCTRPRAIARFQARGSTGIVINRSSRPMHAIRINIEGPSFRQHVAKSRAERALPT